jgi:hypothetical protein
MIKGTYIIYQNGKEICRTDNVITKFGKRFLTEFIAGNVPNAKKDIALGISSTGATVNDTRLGFEFYRIPVSFGSTNIQTVNGTTTYGVVYKATIPQDVAGKINELGLYPSTKVSSNNYDSKFISDFSTSLLWKDADGNNPQVDYNYSKIGDSVLKFKSNASTAKEYFYNIGKFDMSGYSVNDSIKLSYYQYDTRLSGITVKFYTDNSNYYTYTFTASGGVGYHISPDILLSSVYGSSVGSPDKTQISKIGISIATNTTSLTSVGMDGFRINDEDTFDPTMGLISRAVLSEFTKQAGQPIDIEYRLNLGF